ncbi:hypothetical protein J5N97_021299 [Dioscorea zingiberensis]|uniref:VQ domain-containing protein n=1 Tax=Dioscorea zingiberensis TaxID=325984 RepID=A0A9D5CHZ7_9LILI|nr:hypothetical protein J5N97_021299 [Dioscorea zingiberensis]
MNSSSSSSSFSSFSGKPPPHQRELQGPRPTPLRLSKDSHKIKKSQTNEALPKQPVIIYMASPKIIHTNPRDFMSLVQRLTGTSSSSMLSPAAHLALEKPPKHQQQEIIIPSHDHQISTIPSVFPGILSPVPASLPPISPGFFSPSVDPSMLSFLHELSPVFHGNRSYVENTFLATSPNFFLSTPTLPSPGSWEIFQQLLDH